MASLFNLNRFLITNGSINKKLIPLYLQYNGTNCSIKFKTTLGNTLQYSYDLSHWYSADTISIIVLTSNNPKLYLRGKPINYRTGPLLTIVDGFLNLGGNIMSLIYGDHFTGKEVTFPQDSTNNFQNLFLNCTGINEVSDLRLPAKILTEHCYQDMFKGCTNLTTVPELPAMELAEWCYCGMFYNCSSLSHVPKNLLPAVVIPEVAYNGMFVNCVHLLNTPDLPASSISAYCYENMFNGCSLLSDIPTILPSLSVPEEAYLGMFHNCENISNVPRLPATTLGKYCYQEMFMGCRSLYEVPNNLLPATVLAGDCYNRMFKDCISLQNVPELPAYSYINDYSYYEMFAGCTTLETVPYNLLPGTNLGKYCYTGMFKNCINLITTPILRAEVLRDLSYGSMFAGCIKITSIVCYSSKDTVLNHLDRFHYWLQGTASDTEGVLYVPSQDEKIAWETQQSTSVGPEYLPQNWSVQIL